MNWLDEEVGFYDFIWKMGTEACACCINDELLEDFESGGEKFQEMVAKILEMFPTRESAWELYIRMRDKNETN